MSCYFGAEACAKGHVVDCPAREGDPWAEETKPTAPALLDSTPHQYHDWMGNRSITGKRVEGGGLRCERCGQWVPNSTDPRWGERCAGISHATATAAPLVLSAGGVATGWRQVGNGKWVLDDA